MKKDTNQKRRNPTTDTQYEAAPQKKRFSERLRRDFRYGTNAVVLIAAVLVVFVILNLVMERFGRALTLDLTKEKLFSIGEVTRKNLEALDRDVEIIALYDRVQGEADSNRVEVIKILDLYDEFDRVSVSYKDPDANPGLIREAVGETDAASYEEGDYIVKCGNKTRRIAANDMFIYEIYQYFYRYKSGMQAEQKLTSAILYVTADHYPAVYCVTGHGEKSRTGFTMVFNRIEALGCDIRDLDLASEQAIPEDASVLVFLGPTYDLTETERNVVQQWLVHNGGQLIFCADPDQAASELTNFNQILTEEFGLSIRNDQVLDEENKFASSQNANSFIGTTVSNGPIANSEVYPAYLVSTRSVDILSLGAGTYIENYPIIQTQASAVSVSMKDQSRIEGVQAVAAASLNTRYVQAIHGAVFGSTESFSDTCYANYGRYATNVMSIFVMSVDWMIESYGENAGNTINKKLYDTATVVIDQGKGRLLGIVAIVVIPVLIIGTGVVVWLRRRHL